MAQLSPRPAAPGGCCCSTASRGLLPFSWTTMGSIPVCGLPAAGCCITGCSRALGGRASRAATSSSSLTSPAMAGGTLGSSPWLCPPHRPSRQRGGGVRRWQSLRAEQRQAPAAGRRSSAGTYLLVGEAVEHGHQEALEGQQRSQPPQHPFSRGWNELSDPWPLLGAVGAEPPCQCCPRAREAASCLLSTRAGRVCVPLLGTPACVWAQGRASWKRDSSPRSCSVVCPGKGEDMACCHLTWKELRKRVKKTLM